MSLVRQENPVIASAAPIMPSQPEEMSDATYAHFINLNRQLNQNFSEKAWTRVEKRILVTALAGDTVRLDAQMAKLSSPKIKASAEAKELSAQQAILEKIISLLKEEDKRLESTHLIRNYLGKFIQYLEKMRIFRVKEVADMNYHLKELENEILAESQSFLAKAKKLCAFAQSSNDSEPLATHVLAISQKAEEITQKLQALTTKYPQINDALETLAAIMQIEFDVTSIRLIRTMIRIHDSEMMNTGKIPAKLSHVLGKELLPFITSIEKELTNGYGVLMQKNNGKLLDRYQNTLAHIPYLKTRYYELLERTTKTSPKAGDVKVPTFRETVKGITSHTTIRTDVS